MPAVILALAGVVGGGLGFRLLRRHVPEAFADGLSFLTLWALFYPLLSWILSDGRVSWLGWTLSSILSGLVAASVAHLLRRKPVR